LIVTPASVPNCLPSTNDPSIVLTDTYCLLPNSVEYISRSPATTDADTPVDSFSWLIANATALLLALAAKLSCSVPMFPATSIVVGVPPIALPVYVTFPTLALAVTWTATVMLPLSGTLAALIWAMSILPELIPLVV
jgi:hypothetical protein